MSNNERLDRAIYDPSHPDYTPPKSPRDIQREQETERLYQYMDNLYHAGMLPSEVISRGRTFALSVAGTRHEEAAKQVRAVADRLGISLEAQRHMSEKSNHE